MRTWPVFVTLILSSFALAGPQSIREFEVLPTNDPATNKINLQKAIDWASPRGAALYVDPSDEPYPIDGGITPITV